MKFEYCKLRLVKEKEVEYCINSPEKVLEIAVELLHLHEEPEEVFCTVCLDSKLKTVSIFEVSRGSLNTSIVHPREVFKRVLLSNANSIIFLHNHPSGDPTPSTEDINITRTLVEAGNILGIKVLDHVIIGDSVYSLKQKGIL